MSKTKIPRHGATYRAARRNRCRTEGGVWGGGWRLDFRARPLAYEIGYSPATGFRGLRKGSRKVSSFSLGLFG